MVSGSKDSCKSNNNFKVVGCANKTPSYLRNEKVFAIISLWVSEKSKSIK